MASTPTDFNLGEQPQQPNQANARSKKMLFVGNSSRLNGETLYRFFRQFGEVETIIFDFDKTTVLPLGYAFVTMASEMAAQRAVNAGTAIINGETVSIQLAADKLPEYRSCITEHRQLNSLASPGQVYNAGIQFYGPQQHPQSTGPPPPYSAIYQLSAPQLPFQFGPAAPGNHVSFAHCNNPITTCPGPDHAYLHLYPVPTLMPFVTEPPRYSIRLSMPRQFTGHAPWNPPTQPILLSGFPTSAPTGQNHGPAMSAQFIDNFGAGPQAMGNPFRMDHAPMMGLTGGSGSIQNLNTSNAQDGLAGPTGSAAAAAHEQYHLMRSQAGPDCYQMAQDYTTRLGRNSCPFLAQHGVVNAPIAHNAQTQTFGPPPIATNDLQQAQQVTSHLTHHEYRQLTPTFAEQPTQDTSRNPAGWTQPRSEFDSRPFVSSNITSTNAGTNLPANCNLSHNTNQVVEFDETIYNTAAAIFNNPNPPRSHNSGPDRQNL